MTQATNAPLRGVKHQFELHMFLLGRRKELSEGCHHVRDCVAAQTAYYCIILQTMHLEGNK